MINDMNFRITEVSRVIRRTNSVGWHIDNLYYEHDYVIVLILSGNMEYLINGQTYHIHQNDVLFFPPKTMRSGKAASSDPLSFITIAFRMEYSDGSDAYFHKLLHIWRNAGDPVRNLFLDTSRTWTGKNPLYQVKCNFLTTETLYKMILSEMPSQKLAHIRKLEKARTAIQENFKSELSVEELASSIDLSVSYFRKLFHEAYGCSPMQYIINLRIEHAKDLLQSGEANVTEAAQQSGFEDIYYFSTLFKKKTGSTPSQIMRK